MIKEGDTIYLYLSTFKIIKLFIVQEFSLDKKILRLKEIPKPIDIICIIETS